MSVTGPSRKIRVGVLRGGPSGEYNVSLRTGKNIINALRDGKNYAVQDIFIDRDGVWHIDGVARAVERIFPHVDVVVNALHGAYGEDGRVQRLLESHHIPFTGSGSLGSALGMNKHLAKRRFKMRGLLTPEHFAIEKTDYSQEIVKKIIADYPHLKLVKPASSGSSLGVSIINDCNELEKAIVSAFEHSDTALVEEYIKGREATCGVIESGRASEVYALQPIEIRHLSDQNSQNARDNSSGGGASGVWTYASKYNDALHELICPAGFAPAEITLIQRTAVEAHKALGLRHYSRSDFIVNRFGVYILETNTLPGLTPTSLFPKALSVAGLSLADFLDHIIAIAMGGRS